MRRAILEDAFERPGRTAVHWAVCAALILGASYLVAGCDGVGSDAPNRAPIAEIAAPEDGSTYREGREVTFEARVGDPDGPIPDSLVAWRSTLDGLLGAGRSVSSGRLSPGDHRIWLVARDTDGAVDSTSIGLHVADRTAPEALPYAIRRTFTELTFDRPTNMEPGPSGERFYLTEQKGIVRVVANDPATTESEVMLDVSDRVLLEDVHTAEGLLGFALDPDFAENGVFYLLYTAAGPDGSTAYTPDDPETGVRTILARYRASGPTTASAGTEEVLLTIDQPYIYHDGGQMAFGPDDGLLYLSMGDGGKWGDPDDRAQDTSSLHGTIMRIDPDGSAGDRPYGIPSGNPFAGEADGRGEIYAYGLRNVWRFSFDDEARLWAGDVGQNGYEEVNLIEKGGNYGWDHREGRSCYEPKTGCRSEGLTDPVWDYPRSAGYSVNGGYVYRGSRLPDLRGTYVYGDHVNTRVWSLTYEGGTVTEHELIAQAPDGSSLYREGQEGGVSTFAEGPDGHLYLLGLNGRIYHLVER